MSVSPRDDSCALALCAWEARETVEHPQRGELKVCRMHARAIKAIPSGRFVGKGGGA